MKAELIVTIVSIFVLDSLLIVHSVSNSTNTHGDYCSHLNRVSASSIPSSIAKTGCSTATSTTSSSMVPMMTTIATVATTEKKHRHALTGIRRKSSQQTTQGSNTTMTATTTSSTIHTTVALSHSTVMKGVSHPPAPTTAENVLSRMIDTSIKTFNLTGFSNNIPKQRVKMLESTSGKSHERNETSFHSYHCQCTHLSPVFGYANNTAADELHSADHIASLQRKRIKKHSPVHKLINADDKNMMNETDAREELSEQPMALILKIKNDSDVIKTLKLNDESSCQLILTSIKLLYNRLSYSDLKSKASNGHSQLDNTGARGKHKGNKCIHETVMPQPLNSENLEDKDSFNVVHLDNIGSDW